jgi:hypothetical protein
LSTPIAATDVAVAGCGIIRLATAGRLVAAGPTVVLVAGSGVVNGPGSASGGLVRAFVPAAGGPRHGLHPAEGHVRSRAVPTAAGTGSSQLSWTAGVRLPLRSRAVS